jgi:Histidine kinase-, DNA gyrase B-, and HSP90-like ATPase
MRLSGVDPGIIRELSGIYKPFVKAFKELISNAHDADASKITVTLSEDFATMEVADDGVGMTPFDFHRSFARLGGSTAWQRGGKSPKGRSRIGYKGIGFLAVARYCSALRVETYSIRPYRGRQLIRRRNRKLVPLEEIVGDLVPVDVVAGRTAISRVRCTSPKGRDLRIGRDFVVEATGVRLLSAYALRCAQFDVRFEIDCKHLALEAVLDFDYLLGLERKADLRTLDDFCSFKLRSIESQTCPYTKVRLQGLKEFVIRDLSAPRAKGKARNIVFKSGKEQFLWRLARTAPIRDDIPENVGQAPLLEMRSFQSLADLPKLEVKWRGEELFQLKRPIYLPDEHAAASHVGVIPVSLDEAGLRATGYLLARSEVVYPAELRGLTVRVRNVAIGDAGFLGWESILSGPRKAALSQITGEIVVLSGLDAGDAINPGRESFYEENAQYRILRRALFGSEESIGGLVGRAVRDILDRIHVRSQVSEKLGYVKERRKTLVQISSAVNFYTRDSAGVGNALADFFRTPMHANGLAGARDVSLRPGHKLGGFEVEPSEGPIGADVRIDFENRKVFIDFDGEAWNTTIYLNGHYYDVVVKQGRPEHPICEFDNERRRIYVNWGHPVKLHMDDASFLKSAILLRLAHHAAPNDANAMMDLALNMLSFRAE